MSFFSNNIEKSRFEYGKAFIFEKRKEKIND